MGAHGILHNTEFRTSSGMGAVSKATSCSNGRVLNEGTEDRQHSGWGNLHRCTGGFDTLHSSDLIETNTHGLACLNMMGPFRLSVFVHPVPAGVTVFKAESLRNGA